MKLIVGDVFRISTGKGFGFLQYAGNSDPAEHVRIIDGISEKGEITQADIDRPERWSVDFLLKAAIKRKIVFKVANFNLPVDYKPPLYARSKHLVRGEFHGWFIVNRKTLQREFRKELTSDELKLSPFGIMNDTLIVEYLENDWRPEQWR